MCKQTLGIGLFALVLVVPAPPAVALETAERELAIDHEMLADGTAVIENLLGSVRIVHSKEEGALRVEARVAAEAKTPEEARALVEAVALTRETVGAETTIHVSYPPDLTSIRPPKAGLKGLISRWTAPVLRNGLTVRYDDRFVQVGSDRKATGLAVHLTVHAPFDRVTTVRQQVGSIAGSALRGHLRLEAVDGNVEISRCFGTLDVSIEQGRVSVHALQGEALAVRSGKGDVELLNVRVDRADLQSESGSIAGSGLEATELLVASRTGDVRIGDVEPEHAQVETGAGAIDLTTHMKSLRDAEISTASGDVTLRVGKLSHFDLVAATRSGEVKILGDMPLNLLGQEGNTVSLEHGGGGAYLSVSAPGGHLTVRPYDASR